MDDGDQQQQVGRVVRGGATMFPRETPRPKPLEWLPLLKALTVETVRGPLIATIVTKLTFERFTRFAKLRYGNNEQQIFSSLTTFPHVCIYLGSFAFFELLADTEWLKQYKLPRTPAQEPTQKMKRAALWEFFLAQINNYFVVGPVGHFAFTHYGGKMPSVYSPLPSFKRLFLQYVVCLHFNQYLFAIAHRLFHHGPLYRAFHKKHHEFVGTISIAAENAHPVESLLANTIPTIGASFLMGVHPYVFYVWLVWRIQQTLESHSGYCFYGSWLHSIGLTNSESAAFHDFHHTENKGAFGSELADHVFGTHDAWLAIGRTPGYLEKARLQREKAKQQPAV